MIDKIPTAFISYSWDNDSHKAWVRDLSTRLRTDGVNVILDQWDSIPGDQLPEFMEKSIRENDYVLIICTQNYKNKSNKREGGVGYEGDIITAELFSHRNNRKFIPILRGKAWNECAPSWIVGKYYISLNNDPYSEDQYQDLLATILGVRVEAPPIGSPPEQIKPRKKKTESAYSDDILISPDHIQIIGVLADEATTPGMDGTRGSALYTIPIKLSNTPSSEWADIFIQQWNHPPRFSTMHRPGIASVSGNRIVLDGTTIEEVRDYHRDTLVLCVEKTNEINNELIRKKRIKNELEREKEGEHKKNVSGISDQIEF